MRLSQMKFFKFILITLLIFVTSTPASSAQETNILDFLPAILASRAFDNDGDGYSEIQGDCVDTDATIFPSAFEICGDGIDQDCDGAADPPCPEDTDNDGDGYSENQGDCDDTDASIYQGAPEICGDGIDQDCNAGDLECILPPYDSGDFGGYWNYYAPIIEPGKLGEIYFNETSNTTFEVIDPLAGTVGSGTVISNSVQITFTSGPFAENNCSSYSGTLSGGVSISGSCNLGTVNF